MGSYRRLGPFYCTETRIAGQRGSFNESALLMGWFGLLWLNSSQLNNGYTVGHALAVLGLGCSSFVSLVLGTDSCSDLLEGLLAELIENHRWAHRAHVANIGWLA